MFKLFGADDKTKVIFIAVIFSFIIINGILLFINSNAYREIICDKSKNICIDQKSSYIEKMFHSVKKTDEFMISDVSDCSCRRHEYTVEKRVGTQHHRRTVREKRVEYIAELLFNSSNRTHYLRTFKNSDGCRYTCDMVKTNLKNLPAEGQASIYRIGEQ